MLLWNSLRPEHILRALKRVGESKPAETKRDGPSARATASEKPVR
jgi:hypothetical protein